MKTFATTALAACLALETYADYGRCNMNSRFDRCYDPLAPTGRVYLFQPRYTWSDTTYPVDVHSCFSDLDSDQYTLAVLDSVDEAGQHIDEDSCLSADYSSPLYELVSFQSDDWGRGSTRGDENTDITCLKSIDQKLVALIDEDGIAACCKLYVRGYQCPEEEDGDDDGPIDDRRRLDADEQNEEEDEYDQEWDAGFYDK